jgi:heme/copper-type cytochrome/quinol oxidase subunit 3
VTAPQLALPSGERRTDSTVTIHVAVVLGVSVLMLLGGLASVYLALRAGTHGWVPKGFVAQEYYDNTLLVTAIISVVAGWWGVFGVVKGARRQAVTALALVVLMDAAFLNLLTYVVRQSHLSPRQDAYAVVWYALVIAVCAAFATAIGVAVVVLARVAGGLVTAAEPALAWCAAWYTTFVAAAWLVMYYLVHVVQ